jgi:hypothetical protein
MRGAAQLISDWSALAGDSFVMIAREVNPRVKYPLEPIEW